MCAQHTASRVGWTITFSHLVSSFATSHVDDDITVRELGYGLGNDRLAGTESSWNGGRTALYAAIDDDVS
jgi:hypothetical protein